MNNMLTNMYTSNKGVGGGGGGGGNKQNIGDGEVIGISSDEDSDSDGDTIKNDQKITRKPLKKKLKSRYNGYHTFRWQSNAVDKTVQRLAKY